MAEQAMLIKASETKGTSVSTKPKENLSQSIDSPMEQILHLQRTIGNQAVQRLLKSGAIQAKLKIGKPDDKYEREAEEEVPVQTKLLQREEAAQEEDDVCEALRSALDNSRRVIALYHRFLAGNIDWDSMRSQLRTIGNAAQGVTGAGHDLPQVVQDAIEEVESFGVEEILHMGRLIVGFFGSDEYFQRQWVTNEIERQQHFNLVIIESMYAHGCPDFPGTLRGYQEQVLSVGTRGWERRSAIESPRRTRTGVAWVEIGGEEVLVLATEVAGARRLRFVRWIDSNFRDLALQQARGSQGTIPSVPGTAVNELPSGIPDSAARR